MKWYDTIVPMRSRSGLNSTDFDDMVDQYFIQVEDELLGEDWLDCYATEILYAKCKFIDVTEVVKVVLSLIRPS